jgi:hypothetical protein
MNSLEQSAAGTVSLSPTISQYFMESLPFSSPDEFPTPPNLRRAPSFRMFGRRIADIIKRFARQRDDMRPKEIYCVRDLRVEWKLLPCSIDTVRRKS